MKNKNLLKFNREAVAVLGGVIRKKKDGTWRTSNLYENGESLGSLGDGLRVRAAALLYHKNSNYLIIASGGKGRFKRIVGVPAIAQVIKAELIKLNVPERAVMIEDKSGSTYEQLQKIKKILVDNSISRLVVISNAWHLPRVKAMVKLDPDLNKTWKQRRLILKSAEKILISQNQLWKQKIAKAYNKDKIQQIIKSEKQGIKDLLEGNYVFKKIL